MAINLFDIATSEIGKFQVISIGFYMFKSDHGFWWFEGVARELPNPKVTLKHVITYTWSALDTLKYEPKGVYLQVQGEMMTCTGHKIIQGEGLKYRV